MGPLGLAELLVLFVLIGLLYVYPLWRIAGKMGYPGFLGILALIPGVNIALAYLLAFTDWPVLRELHALRSRTPGA